jgi:2-deoxy-D-gluconate 3-dehydrogenase
MLNAFDLTGRRALVTGGGGTLGRAMAEALYQAGAEVALMSRSDKVDDAAAQMSVGNRAVLALHADLADRESLVSGFNEAVSRLGGLDILVTSHGIVRAGDAVDYPLDLWDQTLDVNLTSVFALCQLAGQHMISQGRGKIINVASMLSFGGGFRAAAYAASKGGIAQITKALANEWAGKGINVNAVAPGYIQTPMNQHIWKDPIRSEQIMARLPVGRWGTPDDLKGAVVFLASPASDYIHGIILPVDGGWLSR